jgi:prepilin-type N-terminal cleavage/methylation domain-containing protein
MAYGSGGTLFPPGRRVEPHVVEFGGNGQVAGAKRVEADFSALPEGAAKGSLQGMKQTRGFTLVEVMILLLIIALLLAMVIPALQKIKQARAEKAAPAAVENGPAVPAKP